MHIIDWIILPIALALAIYYFIRTQLRAGASGESPCGCAGCPMAGECTEKKPHGEGECEHLNSISRHDQ